MVGIDINQLELLIAVSEYGTLQEAAERYGKSRQAVSKSISKLEKELGVQLFKRTGNELEQNAAGRLVVSYARSIVNRVERIKNDVGKCNTTTKVISIGSSAMAPTMEIQRSCHWMALDIFHPVDYELDIEVSTDEVMLITEFGSLNFDILILEYSLNGRDIISKRIFTEQLYLAVGKEHKLAGKESISISELKGELVFALRDMDGWRKEINFVQLSGVRVICMEESEFEYFRMNGNCPQLRTRLSIEKNKDSEDLVYIPISDQEANRVFFAHYRKGDTNAERIINNV